MYSTVTQLSICIYIFFFMFFSIIRYYKTRNVVPCAVQRAPVAFFLLLPKSSCRLPCALLWIREHTHPITSPGPDPCPGARWVLGVWGRSSSRRGFCSSRRPSISSCLVHHVDTGPACLSISLGLSFGVCNAPILCNKVVVRR